MFVSVKCYNDDFNKMTDKSLKAFFDSNCNTAKLEYNVDLNVNHIISLEEGEITFGVEKSSISSYKSSKVRAVIATMTNGKQFIVKADSIPELKLKAAIAGNGDFE